MQRMGSICFMVIELLFKKKECSVWREGQCRGYPTMNVFNITAFYLLMVKIENFCHLCYTIFTNSKKIKIE